MQRQRDLRKLDAPNGFIEPETDVEPPTNARRYDDDDFGRLYDLPLAKGLEKERRFT